MPIGITNTAANYDGSEALGNWKKLLNQYGVSGTARNQDQSLTYVPYQPVISDATMGAGTPGTGGTVDTGNFTSDSLDRAQTGAIHTENALQATGTAPGEPEQGFLPFMSALLNRSRSAAEGFGTGAFHQFGVALENMGVDNSLDEWTADPRYADINSGDDVSGKLDFAGNVDDTFGRFWRGIRGETDYGVGDFKQGPLAYNDANDSGWQTALKAVPTFAIDTLSDPLTYLTFGAATIGKAVLAGSMRAVAKSSVDDIAEAGIKVLGEGSDVFKATRVMAAGDDTAGAAITIAAKTGDDAAELAAKSSEELVAYMDSPPVLKAFAADKLADDMVSSYYQKSARGLRQQLDAYENTGVLNPGAAANISGRLNQNALGGIRFGIPFTRTTSATPLSGNALGAYLGREGAGAVSKGFDKILDTGARLRVATGQTRPVSLLRRNFTGRTGGAWDAWVQTQKFGTKGASYTSQQDIVKTFQKYAGDIDNVKTVNAARIDRFLTPILEKPASYGVFADAINNSVDTAKITDDAARTAAERLSMAYSELFDEAQAAGVKLENVQNFSHRRTTEQYLEWKAKENPLTSKGGGKSTKEGLLKSRQQFLDHYIDADGDLNFESMSIADANKAFREAHPEVDFDVFEVDPTKAFLGYANDMGSIITRTRLVNRLRAAGIMDSADVTIGKGAHDVAEVHARVTDAQKTLNTMIQGAEDLRTMKARELETGQRVAQDALDNPMAAGSKYKYGQWVHASDKDNYGTIESYLGNDMYEVKFVPKGTGITHIQRVQGKFLTESVADVTKAAAMRDLDPNLITRSLLLAGALPDDVAEVVSSQFGDKVQALSQKLTGNLMGGSNIETLFKSLPKDLEARSQVINDLLDTVKEIHTLYSETLVKGRDMIDDVTTSNALDDTISNLNDLGINTRQIGVANGAVTEKSMLNLRDRLARQAELSSDAATYSKSGINLYDQKVVADPKNELMRLAGKEKLEVSDNLAEIGDSVWVTAMYKPFIDAFFKKRDTGTLEKLVFDDVVRPYMTFFKTSATIGRGPGFHFRNAAGAWWNNLLVGVHTRNYIDAAKLNNAIWHAENKAIKDIEKYGGTAEAEAAYYAHLAELLGDDADRLIPAERALRETGLFANTRTADEFSTVDMGVNGIELGADGIGKGRGLGKTVQAQMGRGSNAVTRVAPTDAFALVPGELSTWQRAINRALNNPVYHTSSNVGQHVEQYARTATFLRGLEAFDGDTDSAIALVKAAQFDYSDLSEVESRWVKAGIPFYVWSRHNIPLQFRSIFTEPKYFAMLDRATEELQNAVGDDSETGDYLNGLLPETVTDRAGFLLGDTANGNGLGYALGSDLPIQDLQKWIPKYASADAVLDVVKKQGLGSVAPYIKAGLEFGTGTDTFTGAPLESSSKEGVDVENWHRLIPGLVRQNSKGEDVTPGWVANSFADMIPQLGQIKSLVPVGQSERTAQKNASAWASTLGGVPLMTVTPDQTSMVLSDLSNEGEKNLLRRNQEFVERFGVTAQDIIDMSREGYTDEYLKMWLAQREAAVAAERAQ